MISRKYKEQCEAEGLKAKSEGGKKGSAIAGRGRPKRGTDRDVSERTQAYPRASGSRQKRAKLAGVSTRKVGEADMVADNAPELADDVLAGKLPLAQAVKQAKASERPPEAAKTGPSRRYSATEGPG